MTAILTSSVKHSALDGLHASGDGESTASEADFRIQFEREVAPLIDGLYRVARRLTLNAADAEDLLQDTMVRAYSAFGAFTSQTHMRAWLVRIMRNLWIDDYRRSRRRPSEYLTADVADCEQDAYDRHHTRRRDAVEALVLPSVTTVVRNAVLELPENLQRAVYFAYIEGASYKEIACRECVPLGTVMSRLYRARRQLRHSLGDHMRVGFADDPAAGLPAAHPPLDITPPLPATASGD